VLGKGQSAFGGEPFSPQGISIAPASPVSPLAGRPEVSLAPGEVETLQGVRRLGRAVPAERSRGDSSGLLMVTCRTPPPHI